MQEQFITITRMRKELFAVTDAIFKKNHIYTVTEHGEPKVILLSPKRYTALQKLHEGGHAKTLRDSFVVLSHQFSSVVHDLPDKHYTIPSLDTLHAHGAINAFVNAKKLAIAQLYVKLVDECAYPPERILLDTCVRTGGTHSNKTINIDVLIVDRKGKPWAICSAIPSFDHLEAQSHATQDLFELAESIQTEYACDTVRHLLIFSRGAGTDKHTEQWNTIDAKKFPSLKKWRASGSPIGAVFPRFKK